MRDWRDEPGAMARRGGMLPTRPSVRPLVDCIARGREFQQRERDGLGCPGMEDAWLMSPEPPEHATGEQLLAWVKHRRAQRPGELPVLVAPQVPAGLDGFWEDGEAAIRATPSYFIRWYSLKSWFLVGALVALPIVYQLGKKAGAKGSRR